VVQPKGTTAETLAEQSARSLADRFRKVGEFDVYAGRQPVQMFVASKWPRSTPDSRPPAPSR